VIVGERGFSRPFTPDSAEWFYYRGMYGLGDGSADNSRFAAQVRELAAEPGRLPALGEFSRQFVVRHHALEAVGARLEPFLRTAASERPRFAVSAADGLRTAAVWLRERRFSW
jgi:hypothetical protein